METYQRGTKSRSSIVSLVFFLREMLMVLQRRLRLKDNYEYKTQRGIPFQSA